MRVVANRNFLGVLVASLDCSTIEFPGLPENLRAPVAIGCDTGAAVHSFRLGGKPQGGSRAS